VSGNRSFARATIDLSRAKLRLPLTIVTEKAAARHAHGGLPPSKTLTLVSPSEKRTVLVDAKGVADLGVPKSGEATIE
jgi:hypothetical protein